MVAFLVLLVGSAVADDLQLPVATHGTEQWAGVVGKAMTAGGMSHGKSLQALQFLKSAVAAKMAKTVGHPCSSKPSHVSLHYTVDASVQAAV